MIKLLCQGVLSALVAVDTSSALSLLQEHKALLLDPLSGPELHAELLYYSIKQANEDVIKYLMSLCIPCDVSFYNYCGQSPAGLAVEEGLFNVVPMIVEKTDHYFALYTAVKFNQNRLKEILLKTCYFKDKFLKYLGLSK